MLIERIDKKAQPCGEKANYLNGDVLPDVTKKDELRAIYCGFVMSIVMKCVIATSTNFIQTD
ncbi:hypothetical protein DXV24_02325 [Escherichia albertii]|nr:hypothetical protein [Escherichia albertii]